MSEQLRWPPAWYGDPTGRHDHRWWDGEAWTAHVADAGVASRDEIPAAGTVALTNQPASDATGVPWGNTAPVASVDSRDNETMVTVALVAAIVALLAAFVPFVGVIVALPTLILAIAARRRARTRHPERSGVAVAALVLSSVALVVALLISATGVALLRSSGGELTEAFRAYVECLETQSSAECRVLLEETLERITR
jgi:hypothetical protein